MLTVSTDLPSFDCPAWNAKLAGAAGLSGFKICWLERGSTKETIEVSAGDVARIMDGVGSGVMQVDGLRSVTDPSTGATATAPDSTTMYIIIGAVVGGVVLLAIVAVVVVLAVRHKRRNSFYADTSLAYVPLK